MNKKKIDVRTIVGVAIFMAIVVVLQYFGTFIRFGPFSVSLVLIPIVVGAALYGPLWGAWLGFVFGTAVLLFGDANAFLTINPLGTVVTVLLKGALAGFAAGLVYKALEKKNMWIAVICAAIACPVVNTGVFLLGCQLFFLPTVSSWAEAAGFANVGAYMILGLVGLNFVFELLFNIVFSPLILKLIKLGKNRPQYTT